MFFSLVIMIIGFSGMSFLVGRRLRETRAAGAAMNFSLNHFYRSAAVFFRNLWNNFFLPRFFRNTEKAVIKMKALAGKLENSLEKLDDYLRGKHKMNIFKNNAVDSKYWNNVINFKNGLKNEDKKD